MAALPEPRKFAPAVQSVRGEEPLLIGLIGPPGGGKTVSALRLATGMRKVRPGPVVLIDTEGGRSKKYSPENGKPANPAALAFDFLRVEMTPDFRSHDFLAAIKAQLPLQPAAIIVDTLSDEHEGEGGYLEWHDAIATAKRGEPGYVGGNEWAAWAMPKAARKRLISGLLQIKVPLLFTFRAREKTAVEPGKGGGKDKITNIGWMPVAPLEIVHGLDLTCILPPRANGVPVWTSEKIGEDFIVKLPAFLAPLIRDGALSEDTGEALARWAKGEAAAGKSAQAPPPADPEAAIRAAELRKEILSLLRKHWPESEGKTEDGKGALQSAFGTRAWREIAALPPGQLEIGLAALRKNIDGLAALKNERKPGEDPEEG
jgi:hypothetical protein